MSSLHLMVPPAQTQAQPSPSNISWELLSCWQVLWIHQKADELNGAKMGKCLNANSQDWIISPSQSLIHPFLSPPHQLESCWRAVMLSPKRIPSFRLWQTALWLPPEGFISYYGICSWPSTRRWQGQAFGGCRAAWHCLGEHWRLSDGWGRLLQLWLLTGLF